MILPILELAIFGALITFFLAYGLAGWVGVCGAALLLLIPISARSARQKCKKCGKRPITVRGLKHCGQCGTAVTKLRFAIWCRNCRRIARSELNVQYCNRCGAKN